MAQTYKTLGQVDLTTTNLTDVYEVPAATQSVISTIVLANRTGSATTYSIAVRTEGDAISNKHYIAYGVALAANNSTTLTLGITVEATDIISVSAANANAVSVNIFGAEITSA